MDKDFWDKVNRLEELAKKALPDYQVVYEDGEERYVLTKFIAAAHPAMILKMIVEMRRLEKEADWLAEKMAEASGSMFDDEMEDLGFECSHECEQVGCTLECRKINWKESAKKRIGK